MADPAPAEHPLGGYSHVHVSTANMRVGMNGEFERRSKQEYDAIKAELTANRRGGKVEDREVRFEMMRRRVESASTARQRSVPEGEDPAQTMGLFTAPEGALGDSLTKQDAKWYRKQFTKLSAQHPDMTIMPGTMNWQERVRKPGSLAHQTVLRTTGDVFHGGQRHFSVDKNQDVGDTMGQHARHQGDAEVDQDRAKKWYARGKGPADSGGTFDLNGVKMGYEICGDHPANRIRRELHDKGENPLDVHVVNSAGSTLEGKHLALRQHGVGINSDAVHGQTKIGRAQGSYDPNEMTPMASAQSREPIPGYLGMNVPTPTSTTPLPTAPYDPGYEGDQYAHEHKGRFRLPGR